MVLVRSKAESWLSVDPSLGQFQAREGPKTCEIGLQECNNGPNEECISNNPKSRNGMCQCKSGFERNLNGICAQVQVQVQSIEVQVYSKNITLPENKGIQNSSNFIFAILKNRQIRDVILNSSNLIFAILKKNRQICDV